MGRSLSFETLPLFISSFLLSLLCCSDAASETDMTVTDSTKEEKKEGGASQICHSIDVTAVD